MASGFFKSINLASLVVFKFLNLFFINIYFKLTLIRFIVKNCLSVTLSLAHSNPHKNYQHWCSRTGSNQYKLRTWFETVRLLDFIFPILKVFHETVSDLFYYKKNK